MSTGSVTTTAMNTAAGVQMLGVIANAAIGITSTITQTMIYKNNVEIKEATYYKIPTLR
ncbi:hypothetical protein [Noviherbaspirillum saxi]|uniref:hypothetical protein n=1 Tax=Noviherbaspirillum saxi TaxID=2320863 RepID=UPI001314D552|nr:hypothetical protein [Noviherbaspirillum saxi]